MNFDDIYKRYCQQIFNYFYYILRDYQAAEDCTQEVFLDFSRKMNRLKLTTDIAGWLYSAAKIQIKRYYRKRRKDKTSELIEEAEVHIDVFDNTNAGLLDEIVTEDELMLLNQYYISGEPAEWIAKKYNISMDALYQRVRRIKQKVIKNSDKLHNFVKQ